MTTVEKKQQISEVNPDALFADGFEAALIGSVSVFNKTVALYSYERCLSVLMSRDKMTREEAIEYFEFNVSGAYVGENTPAFAYFFDT